MIPCICIDDSFRPNEIPLNKWVKKGNEYHITSAFTALPQRKLGVKLFEIELTPDELPYKFFLANRFAFRKEHLDMLRDMIEGKDDFNIDEIIKECNLETTKLT